MERNYRPTKAAEVTLIKRTTAWKEMQAAQRPHERSFVEVRPVRGIA